LWYSTGYPVPNREKYLKTNKIKYIKQKVIAARLAPWYIEI
jgi:hypothetical protein